MSDEQIVEGIVDAFQKVEEPEVGLFVVHDEDVNLTSPIYEAPNDFVAVRNFRTKTMKDLPEGFDKSKILLYKVGVRKGVRIVSSSVELMGRGQ